MFKEHQLARLCHCQVGSESASREGSRDPQLFYYLFSFINQLRSFNFSAPKNQRQSWTSKRQWPIMEKPHKRKLAFSAPKGKEIKKAYVYCHGLLIFRYNAALPLFTLPQEIKDNIWGCLLGMYSAKSFHSYGLGGSWDSLLISRSNVTKQFTSITSAGWQNNKSHDLHINDLCKGSLQVESGWSS